MKDYIQQLNDLVNETFKVDVLALTPGQRVTKQESIAQSAFFWAAMNYGIIRTGELMKLKSTTSRSLYYYRDEFEKLLELPVFHAGLMEFKGRVEEIRDGK